MTRNSAAARFAGVVAGLALVVVLAGQATAQSPSIDGAMKIRVETTDSGFKCAPPDQPGCLGDQDGNFVLQVPQGQLVELTFAWAHQSYIQEEHIVLIDGYKLESDKMNFDNRNATFKFIADRPGTFDFKCDLECDVHDSLQRGYLRVSRGGGAGGASAATFTATNLLVVPSSYATAGDPVSLMFELKDAAGHSVPKAEIEISLDAEFAGTKNKMLLGKVRTDANGVGFFEYVPRLAASKHAITSRYEGGGIYSESATTIVIEEAGVPPAAYETQPIGLEGIHVWAPRVFAGVAIAIWLTFGYVLFRAVSVCWVRERPATATIRGASAKGSEAGVTSGTEVRS